MKSEEVNLRIAELRKQIQLYEGRKIEIAGAIESLRNSYLQGFLAYKDYLERSKNCLQGKTPRELLDSYNDILRKHRSELNALLAQSRKSGLQINVNRKYLFIFFFVVAALSLMFVIENLPDLKYQAPLESSGLVFGNISVGNSTQTRIVFRPNEKIDGNFTLNFTRGEWISFNITINVSIINTTNRLEGQINTSTLMIKSFLHNASIFNCVNSSSDTPDRTMVDVVNARNWEGGVQAGYGYNNTFVIGGCNNIYHVNF